MVENWIFVKAKQVVNYGDGMFGIVVEGRELSSGTLKLLHELFPNTTERLHELLSVESLLASIANDFKPTEEQIELANTVYAPPPDPRTKKAIPKSASISEIKLP